MQKNVFFLLTVFFLVLISTASYSKVIEIKELKGTIDIEEGWIYSGNGSEDGIFMGSDTSSMSVSLYPSNGKTLQECAIDLSAMHNGTEPVLVGDVYFYRFNNDKTTVFVATHDEKAGKMLVVGMTPRSDRGWQEMIRMIDTLKNVDVSITSGSE